MSGFRNKNLHRRRILIVAAIAVVLGLCGYYVHVNAERWLAAVIVTAPNKGSEIDPEADPQPTELKDLGIDRQLRIRVGPPDASLSVWIIEPEIGVRSDGEDTVYTVLIMHGINDDKRSMVGIGKRFSSAGFRAVLVDLRGHGRSSGDWFTYGVRESHDLRKLLNELTADGMDLDRTGAVGFSYGGAVAIQLAAIDPRIKAVAAVSTFESMTAVVPDYVGRYIPSWILSRNAIDRSIVEAGRLADFDPAAASTIDAICRTQAHVLLIHGEKDKKVPCRHSRILHSAAAERSRLTIIADEDHDSMMGDKCGSVANDIVDWIDLRLRRSD